MVNKVGGLKPPQAPPPVYTLAPQATDVSEVDLTLGSLLCAADINEMPFHGSTNSCHPAKSDLAPTDRWI